MGIQNVGFKINVWMVYMLGRNVVILHRTWKMCSDGGGGFSRGVGCDESSCESEMDCVE